MAEMPQDERERAAEEGESAGTGEAGTGDAATGVASRQRPGSGTRTVLNSQYELREIVVAQGLEAHNSDIPEDWQVPRPLGPIFPDNDQHQWAHLDDTSAEFISHTQRVRYTIRLVDKKDDYKRVLETSGLHVMYCGHARYGRGPCFGTTVDIADDWELGSDPNTTGIYRMAYPVILIPLSDVEHHGYRFYPVAASHRIQSGWCHPEVNPSQLSRIRYNDIPDNVRSLINDSTPADAYWGTRGGGHVTKLLLWAGWNQTVAAPHDLGATDLKCRCFCHFGCSTKIHNWRILRERKEWKRTATDRFAYFTTAPSNAVTPKLWLRSIFEYPRRNDYESWYASLEWARRRCNQLLRAEGARYSVW